MKLGAFSVSLNVKDLQASMDFYEKLGFEQLGGNMESKYLIMKNGNAVIGLFHEMFPNNILTFNPGWDEKGTMLNRFDDIRVIQNKLNENGIEMTEEIDTTSKGPASFMVTDPDGNTILIDQHV